MSLGIWSFGEDRDGELYAVSSLTGGIYRLVPNGSAVRDRISRAALCDGSSATSTPSRPPTA